MTKYFWQYNMQNFLTFSFFHIFFLTQTIVAQSSDRKPNAICLSCSLDSPDTDI